MVFLNPPAFWENWRAKFITQSDYFFKHLKFFGIVNSYSVGMGIICNRGLRSIPQEMICFSSRLLRETSIHNNVKLISHLGISEILVIQILIQSQVSLFVVTNHKGKFLDFSLPQSQGWNCPLSLSFPSYKARLFIFLV